MERNDMSSRAEQYKKEMMKLYGKRAPAADPECPNNEDDVKNEPILDYPPDVSEAVEEENKVEECADDDKIIEIFENYDLPKIADAAQVSEETLKENDMYNEPNIAADSSENSPKTYLTNKEDHPLLEPEPTANLGESKGIIRVNVRTGQGTEPIVGASVIVTAISDGKRFLIAAGITDLSGTADISVPAPDKEYSQTPTPEKMPYSLFDVSVAAEGYFNARSVDIPVFSGITSVQNFDMIPAPLLTDPADETLTYFNQEPNF